MEHQEKSHAPSDKEEIASIGSGRSPVDFFGTVIFFVVLVQALLMIGLNLFQTSKITAAEGQLTEAKQKLATADYKTLNNQIDEVLAGSTLLNQKLDAKVKWSNFYRQLGAVTPKNVRFKAMSVTDTGSFKADGETASFTALAQALTAWQKGTTDIHTPFTLDSVVLSNNGYQTEGTTRRVSFSISGQINLGGLK